MDVTPLIPAGKKIIKAYGSNYFKIDEEEYQGALLVSPDSVSPWKRHDSLIETITPEDIKAIIHSELNPEIVIIGTGTQHQILLPDLLAPLRGEKMAVEAMSTSAACRTYNVLLSEERKVVAALLPVG